MLTLTDANLNGALRHSWGKGGDHPPLSSDEIVKKEQNKFPMFSPGQVQNQDK